MYTYCEAVTIVEKYRLRVVTATHRKRGNPPEVIKAMTVILGGCTCRVCGTTEKTQLHHLDGNWKNYTPENLAFFCKTHHFEQHNNNWKQLRGIMSTRVNWSNPDMSHKLVTLVNSYRNTEKTLEKVYEKISSESKKHFGVHLKASTIENRYQKVKNITTATISSVTTMTPSDLLDLYLFAKTMGITVTK